MIADLTVIATCCRDWPVSPLFPIGRCGYCGQQPKIKETKCQDTAESSRNADPAISPTA